MSDREHDADSYEHEDDHQFEGDGDSNHDHGNGDYADVEDDLASDDSRDDDGSSDSGLVDYSEGYVFEFDAAGNLISLLESEHGVLQPENINPNDTFALQADSTVIKTELDNGGTETTVYADTNGDGLFERVSETWTSLDGGVVQTLSYSSSDSNDEIAVRGGDSSTGGAGADNFVIREAAHLRIEDFDDTEGDHLVFDTGLGLTKEAVQQFVTSLEISGADLIIHFGADVSITLVGLAGSTTLNWDDATVLS